MNEIEFERTARHAATSMRAEADRIADSRTALASLLSAEPAQPDGRPAVVVDIDQAPTWTRRRSPWVPILVAAASVAALTGLVLVTRGDDDALVVTTQPSQPDDTDPAQVDDTIPGAIEPDETPAPTTVANLVDGDLDPFRFDVPDDLGQPLAPTTLLAAEIGAGDFDLGWEDCQECEPLRPWAPVVDAEGTIYVADLVNARWRVVGQGASRNIPFADGELVVGSPVIGPDGLLYAPIAAELRQTAPRRVVAHDPTTLAEVASYPVGATVHDRLELVNGQLLLGDTVVTGFDVRLGIPTVAIDHETGVVTVSLSGTQRRFQFPEGWLINGRDAVPIDDGSVVVRVLAPIATDEYELVLVRLWLDGTTAAGTVADDSTTNGAVQITSDGLVQLEGTSVVRYQLPDFGGGDPLAGWMVPEFDQPDLALVPRLLPRQAVPGVVTAVRTEGVDSAVEQPSYSQTWVRTGDQGAVDAIVQIDTRFEPRLPNAGADVEIPRWPLASFSDAVPPVEILDLHSATRSMTVWATGLAKTEVGSATTSLAVDADGVGWATPDLPDLDRWTLVHEGWQSGAASRTIRQQTADGSTYLEMSTIAGIPEAIGTPGLLTDLRLGSVAGRPALLFDDDWRSAVTWSPVDGVVVVLGSYGPLDELYEIARSVEQVDQATWETASILDSSPGDGCSSMFC